MKIEEYKSIVDDTAIFPQKVNNFGIAYSWLGIVDELVELEAEIELYRNNLSDRDKVVKEAGDVFWYITALSRELDLDIIHIFQEAEFNKEFKQPNVSILTFTGNIKKLYRDLKPIDTKLLTTILVNQVISVEKNIPFEVTLGEILEKNYKKLHKRLEENKISGDGGDR